MKDLELRDNRGGYIIATSNSNRDVPDYLRWEPPTGDAFGIVSNTPETRKFLEDVLRRFRRDATRIKTKQRRLILRQIGERDAMAGKTIDAFYSLCHSDIGLNNTLAKRRFRLTESMRAEYEIGYRSAKK